MPNSIKPWLQLIRLPNVVTAAADSLAGCLLATGALGEPRRWLPLVFSSMILYASGTALNDVFDFDIDRAERPNRPLPSGQVARQTAAWLGGLGLFVGPALACMSGSALSGIVAVVLAFCILGYDAGLKHTWLGPVFMGACRGLNLLLGMSVRPHARLTNRLKPRASVLRPLRRGNHGREPVGHDRGLSRRIDRGLRASGPGDPGIGGRRPGTSPFPESEASDRPLIPARGAGFLFSLRWSHLAVNSSASQAIAQPDPAAHSEAHQDKPPGLDLVARRRNRQRAGSGTGCACRLILGAGVHLGAVALFDVRKPHPRGRSNIRWSQSYSCAIVGCAHPHGVVPEVQTDHGDRDSRSFIRYSIVLDEPASHVSDNTLQFKWIVLIKDNLEALFRHNPDVFVSGNLLWYAVEGEPGDSRCSRCHGRVRPAESEKGFLQAVGRTWHAASSYRRGPVAG